MSTSPGPSIPSIPPLAERVEQKLDEAKYFLQCMMERENVDLNNPNEAESHYRFYTSAFLNAVRSPLQYILEEFAIPGTNPTRYKTTEKGWYDRAVGTRTVLGFIKRERDSNIHTMRSATIAHHIVKFDIDVTHEMHQEWPTYPDANKRVTDIAQDAIVKVQEVVDDGKARGYII